MILSDRDKTTITLRQKFPDKFKWAYLQFTKLPY
jgi:hypothetical protein